jgi:hypothetical protein
MLRAVTCPAPCRPAPTVTAHVCISKSCRLSRHIMPPDNDIFTGPRLLINVLQSDCICGLGLTVPRHAVKKS